MKFQVPLTPKILKVITELDEFKGRWAATHTLAPDRLAALKQVATIESVGSSTRIEGAKLSNDQVETLLRGLRLHSFRSRDEQEVAGYAEAMELIFSSWKEIPFTENHVKQLHGTLLKFSEKDQRHRGEYKKLPNNVEAFDSNKKSLGIILETTSPMETPLKMKELLEWTNSELEKEELHALLIISVFVVMFLKIHPFQDGNGRLSRVLTTLLLLRGGYSYVPYSSLERIIEENKDAYYLALSRGQKNIEKNGKGLEDWVDFFLKCLQKQKNVLSKKLEDEALLSKLPELSLQIIEITRERGRASVAEIVTLTKANRNTIKAHLKRLVQSSRLEQDGKGKGTTYRIKS